MVVEHLTKSAAEIELMARAGSVVAEVLQLLRAMIRPGVSTRQLDLAAENLIRGRGGRPAFKGYGGGERGVPPFPGCICASLNDEIVHGIPSDQRRLKDGDIIALDVGVELAGWYGDAAITVPVGTVDPVSAKLVAVTEAALAASVAAFQVGSRLGDISRAIQITAETAGFSVVRRYVGHSIGRVMHGELQVPNYVPYPGDDRTLAVGTVLAIEPMINVGRHGTKRLGDRWTVVTADGTRSAHFEHTVALTEKGPRVLTRIGG